MKPSILALALSCFVGIAATPSRAADAPVSDAAIAQRLEARLSGDRTGACVLAAVIDHAQVRRARVCAGTREDGPPDWDAALEIGSVTKTMTAYLVQDLVERGRWSLDDPIARFLPAGTVVPRQGERQILVRDLLTHSAAMPALPPGMQVTNPTDPYAGLTEQALLDALAHTTLAWPIGSRAEYSNFGMMVLSLAVARSEGGSLEAALRERLFKPLAMKAWIADGGGGQAAPGHLPLGTRTPAWTITPNLGGVGMVKASLADMTRYARAALGDGPADVVARLRATQQPLANGYAMNWMRRTLHGHDVVMHEGGTGGFSSLVALDPSAHRGVVLLADTALTDLGGLGDIGLALLGLDVPVQPPRRATPAPASLVRALVGDWQLGALPLRLWQADDGKLMAQAAGQGAFELRHDSAGDFYPTVVDALLTPLPAASADAPLQAFAWRQGGGLVEAHRAVAASSASSAAAGHPAWRDWVGEYAITTQFSLNVLEQGGRLMIRGTGQPAIEATSTGHDRLEVSQVGAVVEFERDAAGKVVAAVLRQGGQVLRGARR